MMLEKLLIIFKSIILFFLLISFSYAELLNPNSTISPKEVIKIQLNKWKAKKIKELIENINNIELEIKKNYNNSILIVTNFILEKSCSEINN